MMGLISGWVRKPMGSLRGEGTGLLRPKRLDNWSRALVATLPVRTSTRFWMIPLLSSLLAVVVVEVKASTRAVVVAGDAVEVVLGADVVVVVLVLAESPPSRPKPKRPPSGAAETMQRRGRRLSKCILKALL